MEVVGNKFIIKCLKELNIYESFINAVKKEYSQDQIQTKKLLIFGAEGINTIDHALVWIRHPEICWSQYHEELQKMCMDHFGEYEKGWIYADS